MNRLSKFTSAAFGMVLLGGLALYQGNSGLLTGQDDEMMGTAVIESVEQEAKQEDMVEAEAPETECDPSRDPENPDFEDCNKLSQK